MASRELEGSLGQPRFEETISSIHHRYSFLSDAFQGSHYFSSCLHMSTSVRLILLRDEALHHPLLLKLYLLDIHRILPLIINGLELKLESQLKFLLGIGLARLLILLLHHVVEADTICELLKLLVRLIDVHVDDVHLSQALQDLPEEVVFEFVVGLNVELFKEVILSFLVCLINGGVPTEWSPQFQ